MLSKSARPSSDPSARPRTVLVAAVALEEAGRRQLLLVAGDDELLPAIDGADGVVGADLRRLVEDDQVERGSRRSRGRC